MNKMENPEKVECFCEVCDTEIIGMTKWFEHIKTEKHNQNFLKFLMIDIGAMTIDEIPEKMDEYERNYFKNKDVIDKLEGRETD